MALTAQIAVNLRNRGLLPYTRNREVPNPRVKEILDELLILRDKMTDLDIELEEIADSEFTTIEIREPV